MQVLVAGTLYGTAASVVWDDGSLRARPDVKQLVEIVADVEEFDLGHPEEAATAIMVALDTVRDIAVHG
jgi:hypothetical protein